MPSNHRQRNFSVWLSAGAVLLCAVAVCAQSLPSQTTQDAALDIPALIRTADHNGTMMHQRLPEYTYMQKRITRELAERGRIRERERLYEAYPMRMPNRHRHVIILVSVDGVPLTPERAAQERAAAVDRMEQVERNETGTDSADRYVAVGIDISPDGAGVFFGISQFLRQCEFSAPRRTHIDNREAIVLTFRPRADVVFAPREKYIQQLIGEVWIDAVDKVVTRLEARLPERETTVACYEQMRLPDGLWVPRQIRLNALGQAQRFNGVEKEMIFEFSEYHHFSTTIEGETLKPPKQRPLTQR
ncbi:MAG TPA: hypothetical protein VFZ34_12895 [Blastocatellia bacterium]|nr:hypothetical protein [Blastocatellia bacterium]